MDIKIRLEKMKEKRKQTPFREFIKTITSLRTLGFYKNSGFTSIFPETDRIQGVISHKEYEENRDNFTDHGIDYDPGISFFENFKKLFRSIKLPPTILFGECENADFTDQTVSIRNGYLSYVVIRDCENVLYSLSVKENSTNVLNSFMVWDNCQNIYFSKGIIKSYNIFYSKHIINTSNVRFSNNLVGCSECISCDNLDNQSYCIENKQYPKEEYLQKKEELLKQKDQFLSRYIKLPDQGNNIASHDVSGNYNIECGNIEDGYYNSQIKDGRNIILIGGKEPGERVYDCFLNTPLETDVYGVFSTGFCDNIYNSYQISGGSHIFYSCFMEACTYCLGCVGLKNKQFCIFNKEYSQEERHQKAEEIFRKMDEDGTLGKPFPGELNPFYFNDTAAYLIDDSFTKEEVTKEGYLRRDEEIKIDVPSGSDLITTSSLSEYQRYNFQNKREIDPGILKKVIKDEKGHCYRITQLEYDFLMKHSLPLPEIHRLERIKLGFKFK